MRLIPVMEALFADVLANGAVNKYGSGIIPPWSSEINAAGWAVFGYKIASFEYISVFLAFGCRRRGNIAVDHNIIRLLSAGFIGFITFALLLFFCLASSSGGELKGLGLSVILGIVVGAIYFACEYGKYRNTAARHHFEHETKINLKNVKKADSRVKEFETESSCFKDANNTLVHIEKLHV